MWRNAAVENLITPEKLSDSAELKRARTRLEAVEVGIQKSEKRVQDVSRKKGRYFQKSMPTTTILHPHSIIDFFS